MTQGERRLKLRVLAAGAAFLGAAATAGAMGLFAWRGGGSSDGGRISLVGQDVRRSALANEAEGGSDAVDGEGRTDPTASRGQGEQAKPPLLRRTEATPREQILAAASIAVDQSDPLRNCVLRVAKLSPTDLRTPVLAASYPGSGSRMLRHLIEAVTGVVTGDEWHRVTRRAVAIKTHYPHSHGTALDFEWAGEIKGAIVLLRNPRDAIPSFCNHLYERKHGLSDHSTKAPVEEWVKWRNLQFRKQLAWWRDTVVHWVERYPADRRLVLTYEGLTGKAPPGSPLLLGGRVRTVHKLAEFLSNSVEGLHVIPQSEMNCVWYKVVKYDEAEHEEGGVTFRSQRADNPEGGSERPYTTGQLEEMMEVFRKIKKQFPNEGDLVTVMESYEAEVARNLQLHNQAKAAQEGQAGVQQQAGGESATGGKR